MDALLARIGFPALCLLVGTGSFIVVTWTIRVVMS